MTESESWIMVEDVNTPVENQDHVRHQRISGFPNPWIWGAYEYTRQLEERVVALEEQIRKLSFNQMHKVDPVTIFED